MAVVCVIGTGRCGAKSFHQWVHGADVPFESGTRKLRAWDDPGVIRKEIQGLDGITVSHKLAWHIETVLAFFPDAKFCWLRRNRTDTIDSMMRFRKGFGFGAAWAYAGWAEMPKTVETEGKTNPRRVYEWYYDAHTAMLSQAMRILPAHQTHVCWVEVMNAKAGKLCRYATATFIGRPDLRKVEFPRVRHG